MKTTWTKEEDALLIKAVNMQHDIKIDWKRICKSLSKSITPTAAYSRYKKIKKSHQKTEWTEEEDQKLFVLHDLPEFVDKTKGEHQLKKGAWEKISRSMGRPKNMCIFRYFLLKKAFVFSPEATRKFYCFDKTCIRIDKENKN